MVAAGAGREHLKCGRRSGQLGEKGAGGCGVEGVRQSKGSVCCSHKERRGFDTHTHTHTHTSDGLRAVASGKPLHKAKLFHLEECPLLQDKTLPVFFGNKSAFCFETVDGMGRGDMVCFLRSY